MLRSARDLTSPRASATANSRDRQGLGVKCRANWQRPAPAALSRLLKERQLMSLRVAANGEPVTTATPVPGRAWRRRLAGFADQSPLRPLSAGADTHHHDGGVILVGFAFRISPAHHH